MYNYLNTSNLPSKSTSHPFYARSFSDQHRSTTGLGHQTPDSHSYRDLSSPALLPRDISIRFGERLREMRKARNMTQLRMAIDFGIDRSFISDVECGKKSISLTLLEVIALGLDVKLSDLLRGL
jgi:DNA-binding XRE family transcriptional regulator